MADLSTIYPGINQGYTLALKNVQGAGVTTFGNIYYVSSATTGNFIGSDTANNGTSPSQPFATLNQARLTATASQGDVIYLLPGHAETITAAAGVALSKAGLTIIGLGTGTLRPTFTFTTAAAASFDITAANIAISNCIFTNGIDAQTAMINVNKTDISFFDCDFNTNAAATGAILGILTAATATRLTAKRCRFLGPAVNSGTTTTAQIQHESGTDYVIEECYFTGKMTQSILNVATVLRGKVHNNVFVVATGTVAATFAAASTPMFTNNRINVPSGTAPLVAAAGFVAGNIY